MSPETAKRGLFFIGGAPKSGTTWVQLLLDGHPDISCEGESHALNKFGRELDRLTRQHNDILAWKAKALFADLAPYPTLSGADFERLLRMVVLSFLSKQRKFAQAGIVGEKTPDNVLNIPMIWRLFPLARFIHVVRDGRDSAVSAWFHHQRTRPEVTDRTYASIHAYVRHMAESWAFTLRTGEQAGAARPAQYTTVRYEDLIAQPAETLAKLLGFLDAEASPQIVQSCLEAADFTRLSGGRRRGQEDRSSFFRSGTPGGWRGHLPPDLAEEFAARAGLWLMRFGYA
ncbi:MAG: sulfotransferase [Acidisphaera sp.]|nr:sulfotransferase [Acidisphaera sp.]